MLEHMVNRSFQLLLGPALDFKPAELHQPPHRLDAVDLRAVRREKLELDTLLLQKRECGPDGRRGLNFLAGVVIASVLLWAF
jgi:hypothetical protein